MASRVSKIYGDAFVSLQAEEGSLAQAMEEVKAVKEIFDSNDDLIRFLHHPQITKDEKMKVVEKILKGKVSDDMTGFLMIIIKKGRYQEIDGIFDYVIEKIKKLEGIGTLKVTSAFPLSKEQKEKIEKKVLSITSYKKLEIHYETDEAIIGGLILNMDDRVVDNSIHTKLTTMGKHLSKIQL